MTSVAFLGLGRMGAPMARRLVDAGHDVVVWNRTASKTEGFPKVSQRVTEAVAGAEVVITMLSGPEALRDVVYETGVSRAMRPDGILVDMSTIGVRAARRLHESVDRATLDAPVGGGVAQAESGELTVLVGGEQQVLARAREALSVLGEVVHCGGPGSGQAAKLVFNAVLAITMSGIGEAVALGERLGLDTQLVLDVLGRGGARAQVERKGPLIAAGDYAPSFLLSLMRKDADLVGEAARDAGAWTPLSTLAAELYERAVGMDLGDGDYSAITELFRRS